MTDIELPTYDYLRIRIDGTLVTKGLLHCGDGETLGPNEWHSDSEPRQGRINSVCIGEQGPYIPASTLRGSLRARCPRPERLFGIAHGDEGQAGAVRLFDAQRSDGPQDPGDQHWNQERRTSLRDGVSLDPITGTAAEHKLFAFEIVPEETHFRLELEADRITRTELAALLGLLADWNGSADTAIGRGCTKGWGGVAWQTGFQVSAITDGDIRDWLEANSDVPPTFQPIDDIPNATETLSTDNVRLTAKLRPTTPLLVNDAGRVQPRDQRTDADPQLEFMRTASGAALIPGSSLRGTLRAQARRILATIAHQCLDVPAKDAGEIIDPLVKQLFGTERRRSPLWIGDARGSVTTKPHPQFFNAICRFTGGVADGKLYWVCAADCPELTLTCTLDRHQQRRIEGDWWKGLLLLLVRDLYEDQIAVGWGKSRGFGAFGLHLDVGNGHNFDDFESLLGHLHRTFGADAPQTWVQALHTRIQDQVQTNASEGGKR